MIVNRFALIPPRKRVVQVISHSRHVASTSPARRQAQFSWPEQAPSGPAREPNWPANAIFCTWVVCVERTKLKFTVPTDYVIIKLRQL